MPIAPTPRPVLEEFEPRILYAADLAAVVQGLGDAATAGAWQSLATTQPTAVAAQEIAFVDLSLPDAQTLVAGLQAQKDAGRAIDIVTIAPGEDGLAVIARALDGRSDLSAIHLLGHGSDGVVRLGSVQLDADLLLARAGEVADWSRALTADADLLIYGCDVAASEAGRELVQSLAALSGADVAASDNATGSALLGGDWLLEEATGTIEAASAADAAMQAAYAGLLGDPVQVNSTRADQQTTASLNRGSQHAVAADAAGNHVVVWSSFNQDGDGWGVYARRFAPDGTPLTAEILVNVTTKDEQSQASVVSDAAGNFIVSWTDGSEKKGGSDILIRRFAAGGTALTGELRVNLSSGLQTNPVIAMNPATGGLVVAWQGKGSGDAEGIWFRRFAADGTAVDSAERRANTSDDGAEANPAVAMDASGRFVVAWNVNNHTYFQRFAADGSALGSRTQVENALAKSSGPAIAMDGAGNFTIVYREENFLPGVWGRGFNADGTQRYNAFYVANGDATSPSIAMAADGAFAVSYQQTGADGMDIFVRPFSSSGSALAAATQVNSHVAGQQQAPSVALLGDGREVVVWSGASADDSQGVTLRVMPNNRPTITSDGGAATATRTVAENTTAVTTVTATDADIGGAPPLTYSIAGGADAARFVIDPVTGVLRFAAAPDFEQPADAGANNVYDVIVQVSDGQDSDTQAIAVTVTNVIDAPPVAQGDAYVVTTDGVLSVPAPSGLLANDSSPEGLGLSVSGIGTPLHGTLSLPPAALGSSTRLTFPTATDTRADWSPDGSRIVFDSARNGHNDIYVMQADGSGQTRLTIDAGDDSQGAWSPDGTRIAFMSNRDGNYDLWLMNADGSGLQQLAATSSAVSGQPAWSPDGSKIAFTSDRSGGQFEIWVVNVNGSGLTRLTNQAGNDDEPVWSPDGSRIAFTSTRDGNAEIYVMNADGSNATRLTYGAAIDRTPDWAADGGKISFISERTGLAQIVVMDADGSNPVVVSSAATALSFADLSPDGSRVAFTQSGDIRVAGLNYAGAFVYTPEAGFFGSDNFIYTVTDSAGASASATVRITVNAPPVIGSDGGGATVSRSVAEGGRAVTTIVASDPEDGTALNHILSGGADVAAFEIDAVNGQLRFIATPDFEAPADADADNVYLVTVRVTDSLGAFDEQALSITVTDVGGTLVVSTTADLVDGDTSSEEALLLNPGADGLISLREAITAANNTAGLQTIMLPSGSYAITRSGAGDDMNLTGDFDIRGDVRIVGAGAGSTVISGAAAHAVLEIVSGAATISGVTIRDGLTSAQGAGVEVNVGASLNLSQSIVSSNVASVSGAGGILNRGDLVLSDVEIRDNQAASQGGGLRHVGSSLLLERVTFANNTADEGGGLYAGGAAQSLVNVTFSGNNAGLHGGGVHAAAAVALQSVTFANNSATVGGSLYVEASVSLRHVLLADGAGQNIAGPGGVTSLGHNLSTDTTTALTQPSDRVAAVAALDPLADNGGFTRTHALRANSLAIDGGASAFAPVLDQRGFARVGSADIGAFEFAGVPNRPPVITSHGGGSSAAVGVTEGSLAVTTVTATDPDPGTTLVYAIVGGADAALLAIDASTGVLSFATVRDHEQPADANADNAYEVIVQVSDGALSDVQAIAVTVGNVLESPVARNDAATTTAGRPVTVDVLANDTLDSAAGNVQIEARDPVHGTVALDGNRIVYTPDAGYVGVDTLSYRVLDDTQGLANHWRLDGSALDRVGSVSGSLINGASTVPGVWGQGLRFDGVDDHALLPDVSYSNEFTLTFWFRLDDNNGTGYRYLYAHGTAATPNNLNVYFIEKDTVTGSGAKDLLRTSLRDADDPDLLASLDIGTAGLADGQWHQYTLTTTSGQGARVYIDGSLRASSSVGGDALNPTGNVYLGADASRSSLRFHQGDLDDLMLYGRVLSGTEVLALTSGGPATAQLMLNVTGQPPVITHADGAASVSLAVPENAVAVATLTATDPDGDTLVWSLAGGADAARFAVEAATGVLRFVTAPDAEAPADVDADGVYHVVVAVSDGNMSDTQTIAVSVADEDEFALPAPADTDPALNRIEENAAIGSTVGIQAQTRDADATDPPITYGLVDDAGGRFSIDAGSGIVRVAAALDFELQTQHTVVVRATAADGGSADASFVITVVDVSEAGVGAIDDLDAAPESVAESAPLGSLVGLRAVARDPDASDTVSYALLDDAGGRFAIDAATGVVRVAGALDAETALLHTVVVEAVSSDGSASARSFTIAVVDVGESAVTEPVDADPATDAVREDAAVGSTTGLRAWAQDADTSDTVSYALLDDAGGRFAIDAATGVVRVAGALDAEAALQHTVVVQAVSSDGSVGTRVFTIAVLPVNESAPVFVAPSAAELRVDEGLQTVTRVQASDPDLPALPLRYTLAGGADASHFVLDGATGELRFVVSTDHEAPVDADGDNRYEITVRASDGERWIDRSWVVVVGNVNEAPQAGAVDLGRTNEDRSFEFGAAELLAASSDPDGDSLAITAVRIEQGSGALADLGSGRWRFTPAADWSGAVVFGFTVSDAALADSSIAALAVEPVDDAPVLSANSLVINQGSAALVLRATDVDTAPEALIYGVLGSTGGQFELVDAVGQPIDRFSQADIDAGRVVFMPDASGRTPSFALSLSDGSTVLALQETAVTNTPSVGVAPAASLSAVEPTPVLVAASEPAVAPEAEPVAADAPVAIPAAASPAPEAERATVDEATPAAAAATNRQASAASVVRTSSSEVAVAGVDLRQLLAAEGAADMRGPALSYEWLDARSRAALAAALDRVHDEMQGEQDLDSITVAGSTAIGTGLSVGYVLWLARGGVLVASLMSSVPAWASVDPLPVLSQMRRAEDGEDPDAEIDPIEGLFERARRLVRRDATDPPATDAAPARAATPEEGA
jgi:Tol biopolymer transport system component